MTQCNYNYLLLRNSISNKILHIIYIIESVATLFSILFILLNVIKLSTQYFFHFAMIFIAYIKIFLDQLRKPTHTQPQTERSLNWTCGFNSKILFQRQTFTSMILSIEYIFTFTDIVKYYVWRIKSSICLYKRGFNRSCIKCIM